MSDITDKTAKRQHRGTIEGTRYCFYEGSCFHMSECEDDSIALTITSPPYWNAIDYDIHTQDAQAWHRARAYNAFGESYETFLENIEKAFTEVLRVTKEGGFCALVVGTILYKGRHYPAPMSITERLTQIGWAFHQDIIWNKVTGGIRRAGCYIQKPCAGYYYPNIMTEYILIFKKPGPTRRDQSRAIRVDTLFTKDIANNIWHIAPVPPRTIAHPCPYPEELVRRILLLYSQPKDIILDPFLGSGQTALVALRHKRSCIGYDIAPEYLKLAVQRLRCPPAPRMHNLVPKYEKIVAK